MISEKIADAINKQINEEMYSFYLYAAMSAHFEHNNLKGFAKWMRVQSDEELLHARKFVDYMHARGGRVLYSKIAAPRLEWDSVLETMTDAYNHECHISQCINELSTLAIQEKDHATHGMLEWFVSEQVEEEANADGIVQQLKMIEGAPSAMFMLDRELAKRTLAPDAGGAA